MGLRTKICPRVFQKTKKRNGHKKFFLILLLLFLAEKNYPRVFKSRKKHVKEMINFDPAFFFSFLLTFHTRNENTFMKYHHIRTKSVHLILKISYFIPILNNAKFKIRIVSWVRCRGRMCPISMQLLALGHILIIISMIIIKK